MKSGIVASRWGAHFQGKPYFLVDAKLFPGSSGSIVVSKPQQFAFDGGQLLRAQEKQFAFLGVFSGEPFLEGEPVELDGMVITKKSGFNLGIVWYGNLVRDLIDHGVPFAE